MGEDSGLMVYQDSSLFCNRSYHVYTCEISSILPGKEGLVLDL